MDLLETILLFFSFKSQAINVVVFGTMLLGLTSAVIGCFYFLQKKSLVGDSIAHSLLPGICIGFMISGEKNTEILLSGAIISGLISVYFMEFIKAKTILKGDTVIALTLTIFFGFGLLLLSIIQNSGNASQSGIDHFLFGKAAALMTRDLWVYGGVSAVVLFIVFLFFKAFFLISFDEKYGQAIGLPVKFYRFILTTITVIAVAIGIQTVGVILMAAMLVTPASGASYWTTDLKKMIFISALIGAFSGLFGAFISFLYPSMPTGPWTVVCLSFITLFSLLFAPKKGILFRLNQKRKWNLKLNEDNVLKALYHIGENDQNFLKGRNFSEINSRRNFNDALLLKTLKNLKQKNHVIEINNSWTLTSSGKSTGLRLAKIHRLWEMYLTSELNIAADHVHEDAESIEHIITPEIERELERTLNYPKIDPHSREIPYE